MFGTIVLLVVSTWLAQWLYKRLTKKSASCPSVPGLPLLGNALNFDITRPMAILEKWNKEHGDVYKINLMGEEVVVVNGDVCYEVLVNRSDEFAGRPHTPRFDWIFHGDLVFRDPDENFKAWRKFLHHGLRQYGSGMKRIESVVQEEIKECLATVEDQQGEPFDPQNIIHGTVLNIILIFIMGKRLPKDDPFIDTMKKAERALSESCGPGAGVELDMMPWLRYFNIPSYKKLIGFNNLRDEVINHWIKMKREETDPDNVSCMMDWLLICQEEHVGKVGALSEVNLKMITQNIWFGGSLTTFNSCYFGLLILINHPEIQSKIYEQIIKAVGKERLPCLDDRANLPYVDAFLLELMRYVTILPFAVPHKAMSDTTLRGYSIPAGTQIWVNLFGLHHDERFFPDPWTFNPDRFIDKDGQVISPFERKMLMPFSAGRRVCFGEQLARARLFLLFTSWVQRFTFLPEDDTSGPPSYHPSNYILGIALRAEDYKLRAVPRK
ncbi:unnamed protein product [Owenia fusiformis]|uniref:Uncharacterized protein n=1 Tax=Owenia fusiformis TaxID=6347 RepID=A0A8J1Y4T0_OWEFU|nr:unnamed protein product [Owenia fusiformis]